MRFWPGRHEPPAESVSGEEAEHAYQRGRADERKRHRGHPVLGALMLLAAVLGVGSLYLAAREGSFSAAGQVVDHRLASATGSAGQTAPSAALAQNAVAR